MFCVHAYLYIVCVVPEETEEGIGSSGTGVDDFAVLVLGFEPGSYGRVASALNIGAICLAPRCTFFFKYSENSKKQNDFARRMVILREVGNFDVIAK